MLRERLFEFVPKLVEKENYMVSIDAQMQIDDINKSLSKLKINDKDKSKIRCKHLEVNRETKVMIMLNKQRK